MAMDITFILRTLIPIVETLEQLTVPYHIHGDGSARDWVKLSRLKTCLS